MTCPFYNSKNNFWQGKMHICESIKNEIDDNHAEKYCLTKETFLNSNPKYNDCPYNKR